MSSVRIKAKDLKPRMQIDLSEDEEFIPPESQQELYWNYAYVTAVGGWHERYCPEDCITIYVEDVGPIFVPREQEFDLVSENCGSPK